MIYALYFFAFAFFVPTAATYAFVSAIRNIEFLTLAEPWPLAMYAVAFHVTFLLLTAIVSWLIRIGADIDLLDEVRISTRGNVIIAAIFTLINIFAMPTMLNRLFPEEFPPSSPSNFHKPGDRIEFTTTLSDRFMAGNIVATGQNTIFRVEGTEPSSSSFAKGENLPATTAPGTPYWGDSIRSTGRAPGVNPVRFEKVRMSFSMLVPLREISTPTEITGQFVFEAIYPMKTGSSTFTNRQSDIQSESISFLAVSKAQAQVYETADATRSSKRPMLIFSLLFSFLYYVALIFFWTI